MSSLRHQGLRKIAVGAVVLLAIGCGRSDLATVGGRVTLDGKPVSGAFLEFLPTSDSAGTMSYGRSDSDGYYTMQFSDDYDGVMPGEYRVRIYTSDLAYNEQNRLIMTEERIPDRYRDRHRSELVRTVEPGKHNQFEFELTSEGRISQPSPGRM